MCGIAGVYGHDSAAGIVRILNQSLQHRGRESWGVAVGKGEEHLSHREMGHVSARLSPELSARLSSRLAIGHVRYSTFGAKSLDNAQPFTRRVGGGWVSIAHNGNLTDADVHRERLVRSGVVFGPTDSDTEIILQLLARSRARTLEGRLIDALRCVHGSFSLVVMLDDRLVAVRDAHGNRPLSIGRVGDAWVVASETCALDKVHAVDVRDVAPGELIVFDADGMKSVRPFDNIEAHICVFEALYFARPDSRYAGASVAAFREEAGRQLALLDDVAADIVAPVPDSGRYAATGYAFGRGIRYCEAIMKSRYDGDRTFILPGQETREAAAAAKYKVIPELVRDQRIVLVDDSVVRGTTLRHLVGAIFERGAREVHVRIPAPMVVSPCHYGIATPTQEELIAHRLGGDVDAIAREIGATSIMFLPNEVLSQMSRVRLSGSTCDACFSGNYPIRIPQS